MSDLGQILSQDFDTWNITHRLEYLLTNLDGFGSLSNWTQWTTARDLSLGDISGLLQEYANSTLSLEDFIAYLQSLSMTTAEPVMTTAAPDASCDFVAPLRSAYIWFMIPISIVFLIGLSFLERRKWIGPGCCGGRPGLVIPTDFISANARGWGNAAVFALISYNVLNLFDGKYLFLPEEYSDQAFSKNYGWSKVFVTILNVLIVCTVYYPLLASITLRRHLAANIVGLLYLTPWVGWTIMTILVCPPSDDDDAANIEFIMNTIFDIPAYIAFIVLYVCYIMDLVKNARKMCCGYKKTKLSTHDSYKYVQGLFVAPVLNEPATIVGKIKKRLKYSKVMGFRYSPRIICAMVCSALVLYKSATELSFFVSFLVDVGQTFSDYLADALGSENGTIEFLDQLNEGLMIVDIEFQICIYGSALLHIIFMIDTIVKYRRHMRQLFRGDHSWHFNYQASPASCMVYGMRYGGYQIAFMLYGWFILAVVAFAVLLVATYLIILPIKYRQTNWVIDKIISVWPTVLVSFVILISQTVLCKFVFLQDRGKYLIINNRRIYHIVDFFLFFYNFLLGLFSCLKRVLFSIVFGTLLIARLDRCLLMQGFEGFDSGHKAYLAMLMVDAQNNHPVMKVFIKMLQELREEHTGQTISTAERRRIINRNRWQRAYTLVRNPSLVLESLQKQMRKRETEKLKANGKMSNGDTVVEQNGGHLDGLGAVYMINAMSLDKKDYPIDKPRKTVETAAPPPVTNQYSIDTKV